MDEKKLDYIIDFIWTGYWADKNDMEEVNKVITEKEIAEFIVELREGRVNYAIRKWDKFIESKHKYPIDVTLEWFQGWLIVAFPNWLKRNKE